MNERKAFAFLEFHKGSGQESCRFPLGNSYRDPEAVWGKKKPDKTETSGNREQKKPNGGLEHRQ